MGGILAEIMAEMWSIVVYCGELRSMCGEVWSRNVGYCGGGGDGVLRILYKIIDGMTYSVEECGVVLESVCTLECFNITVFQKNISRNLFPKGFW